MNIPLNTEQPPVNADYNYWQARIDKAVHAFKSLPPDPDEKPFVLDDLLCKIGVYCCQGV